MAINKLYSPTDPPTANTDWTRMKAIVDALALQNEQPLRVVGSNVVKGALFYIGGTFYLADSDTAISGTASNYVKITPSGDGSTCSASFVSSLTGVTWSATYLGYYDSGSPASFYVFDEGKAFTAGQISAIKNTKNEVVPLGAGWLAVLAIAIGSGWLTALGTSAALFNADTVDLYHASLSNVGAGNIPVRESGVVGGIAGPIKLTGEISGNGLAGSDIYALLSPLLANIGDSMVASGAIFANGSSETLIVSYIKRAGAGTISIVGIRLVDRSYNGINLNSSSSTLYTIAISY